MSSTDHPQCPYTLLSVPRNATITEIKRQYRKLALKHHPDKGGDEAIFKEISAAYEILSDERRRADYDHAVEEAKMASASAAAGGGGGNSRRRRSRPSSSRNSSSKASRQPQQQDHAAADPFDHPFFRRSGGATHSQNFTDPFDLFERVFGEEVGGVPSSFRHRSSLSSSRHGSSSTHRHPSATHPPSRSSSRRDPFDDPFFSSSGMMGGLGTRGGGMEGMMSRMSLQMDAMSSMMDMHHRSMGSMLGGVHSPTEGLASQHSQRSHRHGSALSNIGGGGSSFSSSFSMSSSAFGGGGFGGNGRSESTSTTTRIVNGVQETVTERTVVHPDGRMERRVERASSSGGGGAISTDRHRRYIDQGRG